MIFPANRNTNTSFYFWIVRISKLCYSWYSNEDGRARTDLKSCISRDRAKWWQWREIIYYYYHTHPLHVLLQICNQKDPVSSRLYSAGSKSAVFFLAHLRTSLICAHFEKLQVLLGQVADATAVRTGLREEELAQQALSPSRPGRSLSPYSPTGPTRLTAGMTWGQYTCDPGMCSYIPWSPALKFSKTEIQMCVIQGMAGR